MNRVRKQPPVKPARAAAERTQAIFGAKEGQDRLSHARPGRAARLRLLFMSMLVILWISFLAAMAFFT